MCLLYSVENVLPVSNTPKKIFSYRQIKKSKIIKHPVRFYLPEGEGEREARGREEGGPLFRDLERESACREGTSCTQQPKHAQCT